MQNITKDLQISRLIAALRYTKPLMLGTFWSYKRLFLVMGVLGLLWILRLISVSVSLRYRPILCDVID